MGLTVGCCGEHSEAVIASADDGEEAREVDQLEEPLYSPKMTVLALLPLIIAAMHNSGGLVTEGTSPQKWNCVNLLVASQRDAPAIVAQKHLRR